MILRETRATARREARKEARGSARDFCWMIAPEESSEDAARRVRETEMPGGAFFRVLRRHALQINDHAEVQGVRGLNVYRAAAADFDANTASFRYQLERIDSSLPHFEPITLMA
jgi:hypothetical protein